MATTAEVAARYRAFANARIDNPLDLTEYPRNLKGSSVRIERPGATQLTDLAAWTGGIMQLRAIVYSYSTPVIALVHNTHARQCEQWITPERYSMTTQRHISKIRSGTMRTYCVDVFEYQSIVRPRFYPTALGNQLQRCTHHLAMVIDDARRKYATRLSAMSSFCGAVDSLRAALYEGLPDDFYTNGQLLVPADPATVPAYQAMFTMQEAVRSVLHGVECEGVDIRAAVASVRAVAAMTGVKVV